MNANCSLDGNDFYASTCQKAGYSATVTYEPSATSSYGYHQHSKDTENSYKSSEFPSTAGLTYDSTPTSKDIYRHTPTSKGYPAYEPVYSPETPSSYNSAYYPHPTTVNYPDYPPQSYHKYQSVYSSDGVYAIPIPTSYPDYPYSCSCVCPGKPSNPGHLSYDPNDHSKYQGRPSSPKRPYEDPSNPKNPYDGPDNHSKYPGDQSNPGHQSNPKYPYGDEKNHSKYQGDKSYPGHQSNPGGSYSGDGKSASNFTAVIGVPNKVVERREIDTLQSNYPDVFNMLVLALESLQSRNENNDLSYYQLSGKVSRSKLMTEI